MVPRSALYEAAGKTGIWVVTDGRVFLHPVTLAVTKMTRLRLPMA